MGQREIISSVNRREAHTPFGGYETFEQAKARDNSRSQAILPLDGLWPFAAYPAAEDVPAGWASPTGEELAALPTMPVPSSWASPCTPTCSTPSTGRARTRALRWK